MQCSTRRLWLHRRPFKLPGPLRRLANHHDGKVLVRLHRTRGGFQYRELSLSSIPAVLVPPVVFGGLLITLWTYKCLMMIIFQNKIIYMPSVPPFSRSETVAEYAAQCKPIEWVEHGIKSMDGTNIKLLEGSLSGEERTKSRKQVVVVYFQGNASSIPPRLPYLSSILKSVVANSGLESSTKYTLVAVSYRGYWTSKGRPNQAGIAMDGLAALEWVFKRFPESDIILWGQSIGAGVSTVSLATLVQQDEIQAMHLSRQISGLLLETPFTSLRAMLVALYPQKFLPYRYLTPFLQSTWDSEAAFKTIGQVIRREQSTDGDLKRRPLRVLMLQAENDEIVPAENSVKLENVIREQGQETVEVDRKVVRGALHTEVMVKPEGRKWIVEFLKSVGRA